MEPIVIATGNPHKVEELRAILRAAGVEAVGLADVRGPDGVRLQLKEPHETGATFEENAAIKAMSYAAQTGRACLADDSGLEVDALAGRPGVISSHFCTDGRETGMTRAQRDAANNARLLHELTGVPIERRSARFVCAMALARPMDGPMVGRASSPPLPQTPHEGPRQPIITRGLFEGRIGLPGAADAAGVPRGSQGFGYDPLFLVAAEPYRFSVTSAELAPDEKNRLSHRAAAARLMVAALGITAGASSLDMSPDSR